MNKNIKTLLIAGIFLIFFLYVYFEEIKDIVVHIWSLIFPAFAYFYISPVHIKALIIFILFLLIWLISNAIKKGKIVYYEDVNSLKLDKKTKSFGFYVSRKSNRDEFDFIQSLVDYVKEEKKKNTKNSLILKNLAIKIIKPVIRIFFVIFAIFAFIALIVVLLKDRI